MMQTATQLFSSSVLFVVHKTTDFHSHHWSKKKKSATAYLKPTLRKNNNYTNNSWVQNKCEC